MKILILSLAAFFTPLLAADLSEKQRQAAAYLDYVELKLLSMHGSMESGYQVCNNIDGFVFVYQQLQTKEMKDQAVQVDPWMVRNIFDIAGKDIANVIAICAKSTKDGKVNPSPKDTANLQKLLPVIVDALGLE